MNAAPQFLALGNFVAPVGTVSVEFDPTGNATPGPCGSPRLIIRLGYQSVYHFAGAELTAAARALVKAGIPLPPAAMDYFGPSFAADKVLTDSGPVAADKAKRWSGNYAFRDPAPDRLPGDAAISNLDVYWRAAEQHGLKILADGSPDPLDKGGVRVRDRNGKKGWMRRDENGCDLVVVDWDELRQRSYYPIVANGEAEQIAADPLPPALRVRNRHTKAVATAKVSLNGVTVQYYDSVSPGMRCGPILLTLNQFTDDFEVLSTGDSGNDAAAKEPVTILCGRPVTALIRVRERATGRLGVAYDDPLNRRWHVLFDGMSKWLPYLNIQFGELFLIVDKNEPAEPAPDPAKAAAPDWPPDCANYPTIYVTHRKTGKTGRAKIMPDRAIIRYDGEAEVHDFTDEQFAAEFVSFRPCCQTALAGKRPDPAAPQ